MAVKAVGVHDDLNAAHKKTQVCLVCWPFFGVVLLHRNLPNQLQEDDSLIAADIGLYVVFDGHAGRGAVDLAKVMMNALCFRLFFLFFLF